MLAVTVRVIPVKSTIVRSGKCSTIADVLVGFLVRKWMHGIASLIGAYGEIGIEIPCMLFWMPNAAPFRIGIGFCRAIWIEANILRMLIGDVPGKWIAIQHLPLILPIRPISSLSPSAISLSHEMEIFRHKARDARKNLARVGVLVERSRIVRHHIIKIHPQPKTMRRFHQSLQISLRAILGAHGATAIAISQIKAIKGIEAHRIGPCTTFEGRWQPQRVVAAFGQFRDAALDLIPGRPEVLKHRLRTQTGARGHEQQKHFDNHRTSVHEADQWV